MARSARRTNPTPEARIEAALGQVAEMLRLDQAVLELVEFQNGVAVLRLRGDCPDCEMSVSTLSVGIEAQLRMRVPEVREVRTLSSDGR
ncbi:MAG: NifU family protein [Gemmatimonadaceae bacterium]